MMQKKKVVITGATGGIGSAVIKKLCVEYELILVLKNKSSKVSIKDEFDNGDIHIFYADLEVSDQRTDLCTTILAKFDSIDWIIHLAGYVSKDESTDLVNLDITRKTFEINFFAVLHLTQSLSSSLSDDGGCIFISSSAGISGNGRAPSYSASKGAVINLAKSLALRWKGTKKRSICVCPGPTNTLMRERLAGDSRVQQSPLIIANEINCALNDTEVYKNGTVSLVRDGEIYFVN